LKFFGTGSRSAKRAINLSLSTDTLEAARALSL
jgi:hypothetical protein